MGHEKAHGRSAHQQQVGSERVEGRSGQGNVGCSEADGRPRQGSAPAHRSPSKSSVSVPLPTDARPTRDNTPTTSRPVQHLNDAGSVTRLAPDSIGTLVLCNSMCRALAIATAAALTGPRHVRIIIATGSRPDSGSPGLAVQDEGGSATPASGQEIGAARADWHLRKGKQAEAFVDEVRARQLGRSRELAPWRRQPPPPPPRMPPSLPES